jgi:TIR domain/WD domain, G-beta repeat
MGSPAFEPVETLGPPQPSPVHGGVFISYRREEAAGHAGRLRDRLIARFGENQVFMDVDAIEPGLDFAEEIAAAVESCQILLAVIGKEWLAASDNEGRRRLDDPDDLVRLEIEAALKRNTRVIPVLVGGAAMPRRKDLPDPVGSLARRHAHELSHSRFDYDAEQLLEIIEKVLGGISDGAANKVTLDYGRRVYAVAFSPDGHLLATAGDDDAARIWDLSTRKETARLTHAPDSWLWAVTFSPDGHLLATGGDDNTARLWNLPSLAEKARLQHKDSVLALALSPDGDLLAAGIRDGTVHIWSIATGREVLRFVHEDRVNAVAFSPDGRWLATGGADTRARIWDIATGRETAFRYSHGDWVRSIAFSPDARLLATGSDDRTVRLWDLLTGQEAARFTHDDLVRSVIFSADGRRLASGSDDKTAQVWPVEQRGREGAQILASARRVVEPEAHLS